MGARPPSIRPLFPDHKTETNGQMLRFQGTFESSHPPQRGARWEIVNEKPGSSWLPQKNTGYWGWIFLVDICGVVRKKLCIHFFHTFFLIAISSADICHLQSESLLTVWILICCPPGDTVINHGRVIYLSLLIRCPKVRCHAPKVVATTLHDFTCFPWKHLVGTLLFITFCK